jgi:hypothetical protein
VCDRLLTVRGGSSLVRSLSIDFSISAVPAAGQLAHTRGEDVLDMNTLKRVLNMCLPPSINQSITRFSSKRGTQKGGHSQTTFGDS